MYTKHATLHTIMFFIIKNKKSLLWFYFQFLFVFCITLSLSHHIIKIIIRSFALEKLLLFLLFTQILFKYQYNII